MGKRNGRQSAFDHNPSRRAKYTPFVTSSQFDLMVSNAKSREQYVAYLAALSVDADMWSHVNSWMSNVILVERVIADMLECAGCLGWDIGPMCSPELGDECKLCRAEHARLDDCLTEALEVAQDQVKERGFWWCTPGGNMACGGGVDYQGLTLLMTSAGFEDFAENTYKRAIRSIRTEEEV